MNGENDIFKTTFLTEEPLIQMSKGVFELKRLNFYNVWELFLKMSLHNNEILNFLSLVVKVIALFLSCHHLKVSAQKSLHLSSTYSKIENALGTLSKFYLGKSLLDPKCPHLDNHQIS